MELLKNFFMRSPGGENDGAASSSNEGNETEMNSGTGTGEVKKEKGFLGKIKEALRDWSADDQAQQEFDDTQV